jgi:RNA polymerase II C-terminal domain phosphatase-like 3/4
MERYHYFASSVRQFSAGMKSLSEMKKDERESDGILATILKVLKRAHEMFFDPVSLIVSLNHNLYHFFMSSQWNTIASI